MTYSVQEVLRHVRWSEYTAETIAKLTPERAGKVANRLSSGIRRSGVTRLNPKNPPGDVVAVVAVLDALRARANESVEAAPVEPPPVEPIRPKKRATKRSK